MYLYLLPNAINKIVRSVIHVIFYNIFDGLSLQRLTKNLLMTDLLEKKGPFPP
jgi:hypothetical protein